jgi:hypothetical protein
LLDCEGEGGIEPEAHGFALRVERVEVDVCNYAEGRCCTVGFKLREMFVGKLGFGVSARGDREGRGGEGYRRGGHCWEFIAWLVEYKHLNKGIIREEKAFPA